MKRSHLKLHSLYYEGQWKGQATLTTQLKMTSTGYAQSCLPSAARLGTFCSLKCPLPWVVALSPEISCTHCGQALSHLVSECWFSVAAWQGVSTQVPWVRTHTCALGMLGMEHTVHTHHLNVTALDLGLSSAQSLCLSFFSSCMCCQLGQQPHFQERLGKEWLRDHMVIGECYLLVAVEFGTSVSC